MRPLSLRPAVSGGPVRILLLGAHSDDIEIGAGGTVLELAAGSQPLEVTWAVFSAPDERAAEARASASAFLKGVRDPDVQVLSFRESYFPDQWAAIKDAFGALRRRVDPDVVFVHHRNDRHQDHRVLAELAWNTWRDHLILEYEIPKFEGDLGRPNLFVPLSEATVARKIDLLLEHFATQRGRAWFDEDTFRGLMRLRGLESNAPDRHAEAFHAPKLVLNPQRES